MLYGGPLGTYLSGLSSNSPASQNTSTSAPHSSSYIGSNYPGGGLRRSNSRYRQNGGTGLVPSNTTSFTGTTAGANSITNYYYTPQVRRKYGANETEPSKSVNRYSTRPITKLSMSSGATPLRSSSGSPSNSNVFHYSRWSPNKASNSPSFSSNSGYGTSTLGTSASWTSDLNSATANSSIDYKRLYEAEKVATDELRSEVAKAETETNELRAKIDQVLQTRRVSGVEKRKLERKISECEEESKLLDKLRAESDKLQAEHRALVRVVSRLNREQ